MPLIEIKSLPPKNPSDAARTVKNAAWELAKVLGVPAEKVRAVWTSVGPGHYAEGADTPDHAQLGSHPPIVHITCFEGRSAELVEKAIRVVAENVCRDLALAPGNAFVIYHEVEKGRLFVGGAMKS
jgi:phenylpyruvate tautomerase PptA (4-oxalocrotonate tautomerase family)